MYATEDNKQSETTFSIKCEKLLYESKSAFQKIQIYKSKRYGNIMMLDDCFMLTEKGNDQYHDKCVSLAERRKNNINVLIIGGGDFGLIKKLFTSLNIKKLFIVEIDEKVIDVSMKYFPKFFRLNKNVKERIVISIDDGYKWIKNNQISFDVIIVDCTDPNPIAKKLYSRMFYKFIYGSLKKNGVLIQQSGSPILNKEDIIKPTTKNLEKLGFKDIELFSFDMPIYPLGLWSFIKCKKAQ